VLAFGGIGSNPGDDVPDLEDNVPQLRRYLLEMFYDKAFGKHGLSVIARAGRSLQPEAISSFYLFSIRISDALLAFLLLGLCEIP
jgi:hypothetical protein